MFSNLRFGRQLSRVRTAASGFQIPTLEWFFGHATGGALTTSGTLAGDLLLCLDSTATPTPPGIAPTNFTFIGSGGASDEATTDTSIRASYRIATGSDESIGAAGSLRRVALALRGVDTTNFASLLSDGVTFAYGVRSGGNLIVPALGTFPRDGVVVVMGRQVSTNTISASAPMTFVDDQNAASGEAFSWWSGASNSLGSPGTELSSYAGQTSALSVADVGAAAFSIWIPGAPT